MESTLELLLKQYKLVQGSRNVVLDYLETIKNEDLNKKIKEFNNISIANLITHVANAYIFWLANFSMKISEQYFNREAAKDAAEIRNSFVKVDTLVKDFLEHYKDKMDVPLSDMVKAIDKEITAAPFEIFTHTITHEFHHKGQIMTMSRLLGYTPPDADVIRFN